MIDDMQGDFGEHRSHDNELGELAYSMTVQRTNNAVILGRSGRRNMLRKDFREEPFDFEIYMPKRGTYEIQQLKRWVPVKDTLR